MREAVREGHMGQFGGNIQGTRAGHRCHYAGPSCTPKRKSYPAGTVTRPRFMILRMQWTGAAADEAPRGGHNNSANDDGPRRPATQHPASAAAARPAYRMATRLGSVAVGVAATYTQASPELSALKGTHSVWHTQGEGSQAR